MEINDLLEKYKALLVYSIPRSFIRVSFVVEAGKHPDCILVFVD
jgi:hypothetical protein